MSFPLKSRNHFNFFAPNKCRFLFKPIIFVYSCTQSESLQHGLFTVHNVSEMAAYCNLNNNEISKEHLVIKCNMILDNLGRLMLNDQKIPLPNEPQRSPRFVQKQSPEVFCKKSCSQKVCKFHRKTPVLESLFNKVAVLQACNFIKKRLLQHWCFPVKFAKFLNIYFEEHLRRTASICFTSKYYSK